VTLAGNSIGFPNVTYGLDGEGRPYSATDSSRSITPVTQTAYNPAGSALSITYGNSATGSGSDVDTFQYDPNTYRPA
jgi:hypothetical protein